MLEAENLRVLYKFIRTLPFNYPYLISISFNILIKFNKECSMFALEENLKYYRCNVVTPEDSNTKIMMIRKEIIIRQKIERQNKIKNILK